MKIFRLQGFNKFERQLLKSTLSTEKKVSILPFGTLISEGDFSILFSILSVSELKQKRFAFGESFNPDLIICFTGELQERESSKESIKTSIVKEDDFEVFDITKDEFNTFLNDSGISMRSRNGDNNDFLNFFECHSVVSSIIENQELIVTGMGTVMTIVEFAKLLYKLYDLSSKAIRKYKDNKK